MKHLEEVKNSSIMKHSSEGTELLDTNTLKRERTLRSGTPDTVLSHYTLVPDISLQCGMCREYIHMTHLQHHRRYHRALAALNMSHSHPPTDTSSLLQVRHILLQRLKLCCSPERISHFTAFGKVDKAFEVLKRHLKDVDEGIQLMDRKTGLRIKSLSSGCSCDCVYAVGVCSSQNSSWKGKMEDVSVYKDYFGGDKDRCYVAIFDGYHGSTAAERCGLELHRLLLREMGLFDPPVKPTAASDGTGSNKASKDHEVAGQVYRGSSMVTGHLQSEDTFQIQNTSNKYSDESKTGTSEETSYFMNMKIESVGIDTTKGVHLAFKTAYLRMDDLLSDGKGERSRVRWSGTSALTIVIQNTESSICHSQQVQSIQGKDISRATDEQTKPTKEMGFIHIANTGNSRALLIQNGQPVCLTKDHSARNRTERNRIMSAGGHFSSLGRCSRVNGVLNVTRGLGNHGDPALKECVISKPTVSTFPLDQHCQLLVLASHGVWEVFSDKEVATLLVEMLPGYQVPPPSKMDESLVPLLETQVQDRQANQGTQLDVHLGSPPCLKSPQLESPQLESSQQLESQPQMNLCSDNVAQTENLRKELAVLKENFRQELAENMAAHLTKAALLAGAKENVTAIVLLLPACGVLHNTK